MNIVFHDLEIPSDNTVLLRVYPEDQNGEFYVERLDTDSDVLSEHWAKELRMNNGKIDRENLKEELAIAREEYRKMLGYAIDGVKRRLWKTAFDLNCPELSGPMAQEIVFNLQQMAADLAEYEAEAARIGGV